MKVLCINTAFAEAHIAFKSESIQVFKKINSEAKSSEKVLPAIEKVLHEQGIIPKELTHIATVVGPGSFTGIRIGVAIAKGFVCAVPTIKLVAINSLDLMAFEFLKMESSHKILNEKQNEFSPQIKLSNSNGKQSEIFYCIQNAHSKRFFIAKYNFAGERISDYSLVNKLPESEILIKLECEDFEIPDSIGNSSALINISFKPETLLEIALKYIEENNIIDLQKFEPVYIRLSQAEENLIKSKCNK